ncbi:MAG TPA: hypothetical protein VIJ11_08215 [Galbitalea sp.]
MRRLVAALLIGLVLAAPLALAGLALSASPASADGPTPTPTPVPSSGGGSASVGVTIGGAGTGSGGSTGGSGGGRGGGGSTPVAPGVPKKPSVPVTPTSTVNELILNHKTFHPGQTIVATGWGFTPGERVQFVLYPGASPVKSFVTNTAGKVHAVFVLSSRTAAGSHEVEATGWQSGRVASANYLVVTGNATGAGAVPWLIWLVGSCAAAGAIALCFALALGWFPRRPLALVTGG